ncbi:nuclear transport factor 2 family protein [Microbacteriaceae bacterium K1510]|nr:nuclear transport factor 2 family protein [Microbacteriaceae bacterium K1510]
MSDAGQRMTHPAVLAALTTLVVDYWYEVDRNWGRNAQAFYVDDGEFAIGAKVMGGKEAVAGFYRWRETRGERTARHIVNNFRLSALDGNRATFECIMCLYAADGRPVLPSLPAIMIADVVCECERGEDGRWRFLSHRLLPVFEGGVPATIPPDN